MKGLRQTRGREFYHEVLAKEINEQKEGVRQGGSLTRKKEPDATRPSEPRIGNGRRTRIKIAFSTDAILPDRAKRSSKFLSMSCG